MHKFLADIIVRYMNEVLKALKSTRKALGAWIHAAPDASSIASLVVSLVVSRIASSTEMPASFFTATDSMAA